MNAIPSSGPEKIHKGPSTLPSFIALFSLLAGTGLGIAQTTKSPLAGKTIHVYNPWPGAPLFVELPGAGHQMTPVAGTGWMALALPDTLPSHITDFGIRNVAGNLWIGRTGIAATGAGAFTAADFGSGKTLWIVIDPSGPATASPVLLTETPKVIHVLNPWPTTAPVLSLAGGTKKGMLTVPGNCGWFWAFLLKPSEHSFFLEEINGADAYGAGGLGNRTPYNLAPELASKGPSLWLDTDINAWLAADPGKNRPCAYLMAATVRDFSMSHPDFDFGNVTGEQLLTGMVQPTLAPTRKPTRTATASPYFNRFEEWFATVPGTNAETCVDIPMGKTSDGMWQYDSYETPEHGFWPIDDFTTYNGAPNPHNEKAKPSCYVKPDGNTWVSGGPAHNMNFCMESHAVFVYLKGQKFEFRGDDDVWVYINNRLVVDLGGLHTPKTVLVDLDSLGLIAGQTYNFDFFSCDRQPCGSSLKIKTSIYFKQQRALEAVPDVDKAGAYRIVKYMGGSGACGSLGNEVKEVPVPAGSLVYKLWNASGSEVESLGEGSFHNGGIVIATPNVVVDTSKITALPPGNYRVVAFEPASPTIKAEVPFVIANRSWVQLEPPFTADYPKGSTARFLVAHRAAGNLVAQAAPYTLVIPAGLAVFLDSALTQRAAPGAVLTTSVTGWDTLWAIDASDSTMDRSYALSISGSTRTVVLTFRAGSSIQAKPGKAKKAMWRRQGHDALGRKRPFRLPFFKPVH